MFFETKNLCFSYYKKPLCLKDVNIATNEYQKVVFVASKNMGKSTLLKVLSSFENSYFGKILLNGEELKTIKDQNKKFSLILSDPVMFEKKSIKENMDYFCDVNHIEKFSEYQIDKMLQKWEINQNFSAKVKKMSLFEKRKFAIMRALCKDPKILFLDDQFEDLSEDDQLEMKKIYLSLLSNKNLSIILTIGEAAYKILFKNDQMKIDKFFYLCYANVKKYDNLNEFESMRENLDVFKFIEGYREISVDLTLENGDYYLIDKNGGIGKLNKKYHLALANLRMDEFEMQECVFVARGDEDLGDLSANILAEKLNSSCANLYSVLGGEKLI